jgi:NitT/TauT family transport system ATP-binding protein
VPIVAPFALGVNGNAITVSPALYASIAAAAEGNISDPAVSARALARVVANRKARGQEPLTFGMTFPFSTHNYHLRFWMAAGGVDPDEDVRMVVLPPPYMVESLTNRLVDAFCVGAPWNSVAVDLGVGFILHFVSEILARAAEKVLAFRSRWAHEHADAVSKLVRASAAAAAYIEDPANRDEVAQLLGAPHRIGAPAEVIRRTLDGRLKVAPDGTARSDANYLLFGRDGADRPDPAQAAWLYAQMVRWGQAPYSEEMCRAAMAVFRPDLYDTAHNGKSVALAPRNDRIGAFAGPPFDPRDVAGHLAAWRIGRVPVG